MNKEWHNDWDTFSNQLVELLDGGATDSEISEQFRGKDVQWKGLITSVSLDEQYAPGIVVSMSKINKPLANDRELNTNHVFLYISEAEQESWKGSEIGEWVDFTASIPISVVPKSNPRPEIQFSQFEGEPIVGLRLQLDNCRRLGVCS